MLLTIIALTIVFLSIIINKFIVDPQLQYIYWLVVFLLFVSVSNIYMTMYYYVKLRNEPGIKGERGDPGEKGQVGSNGVCEINMMWSLFKTVETLLRKNYLDLCLNMLLFLRNATKIKRNLIQEIILF